jgi:hypothetical protein
MDKNSEEIQLRRLLIHPLRIGGDYQQQSPEMRNIGPGRWGKNKKMRQMCGLKAFYSKVSKLKTYQFLKTI